MTTRHTLCGLALTAALLLLPAAAHAGPPLLCDAFDPGPGHALLPWADGSAGWNSPDAGYDRQRLVADTLRLLSPDAPILARMENLRRATIYAAGNADVAAALAATVIARSRDTSQPTRLRALALFDAGVLLESYAQASQVFHWAMLSADARRTWTIERAPAERGYPLLQQAIALAPDDAGMQFAASLATTGDAAAAHHRRAVSMARGDAALARHLAR
ncbi:MAG: hypothetical protein IT178_15880 [Acidobacteria bacterium]|nr:hypothetical protein [Acidobacteriota bacterium]